MSTWMDNLPCADMDVGLSALALRCFGVQPDLLKAIYGLDEETLNASIKRALTLGRDSIPPELNGYQYSIKPVGMAKLDELIESESTHFSFRIFSRTISPAEYVYIRAEVDGKQTFVPAPSHHKKVDIPKHTIRWFEQIIRFFLRKHTSTDLLVLLPRVLSPETRGDWVILRAPRYKMTEESALQVLSGLSVLGMTHRASHHRNLFLSDLVKRSDLLSSHFWVCGVKSGDELPGDKDLRGQMYKMAAGVLVQNPSSEGSPGTIRQINKSISTFTLDFTDAWPRDISHRFTDWSVRDRPGDAHELAKALQVFLTGTSGVMLHINLPARKDSQENRTHDVRVLGPQAWVDFLKQGHGALRKISKFQPYLKADDLGMAAYYFDEPASLKEIKARLSLEKRKAKNSQISSA